MSQLSTPATTATLLSGTKGWGNGGETPDLEKASNSQSASSLIDKRDVLNTTKNNKKDFFGNRFEKVGQILCQKQTEGRGGRIRRGRREGGGSR